MCLAYDAYEAYEVWKGLFLTPSTACGRSPSLEEGGLWGGESGVGGMSAEIATVRCICNAGLHHCNGWMHLQLLVVLLLFRERGIIVCGRWDALR